MVYIGSLKKELYKKKKFFWWKIEKIKQRWLFVVILENGKVGQQLTE
jgi:hypothetical protein